MNKSLIHEVEFIFQARMVETKQGCCLGMSRDNVKIWFFNQESRYRKTKYANEERNPKENTTGASKYGRGLKSWNINNSIQMYELLHTSHSMYIYSIQILM